MAKGREKKNKERKALWDKWHKLRATTEDALSLRAEEIFLALKNAACTQLAIDAALFARLGNKDEEIYGHLVNLMNTYRDVIELTDQGAKESPEAEPVLTGICEVLASRLKEFEDIRETEPQKSRGINPVTREKRGIIDGAILYASRKADSMSSQFISDLQNNRPKDWEALCAGTITIEEIITSDYFPAIYTDYQEGLRFCLTGLDDLHARKVAGLYTELIEREWEELSTIITVQVWHLETAIHGTETDNAFTVNKILDILREVHQLTGPIIADFQKLLHTPQAVPTPCVSANEFFDVLKKAITLESDSNKGGSPFITALSAEANGLFDKLRTDYMKATYQLQRITSSELLLAEEISNVFVKTKKQLTKLNIPNETPPPGIDEKEIAIQRDIVKGVYETIEIKIESLTDSFKEFNAKGLSIIKEFSTQGLNVSNEERELAIEKVTAKWMENPPTDFNKVLSFFEDCWNSDIYKQTREKTKRQIDSYFEKIEKAALMFKKEMLLYEVCTYEEILTHSVSRLRETTWQCIQHTVTLLDTAHRDLEVILKKNNITVIKPKVHDMFNAFEHEILVAEKQEGFTKGEIIKTLNSGYRDKDQIILRANVVAAR